jgi:hypothetical protein
MWPWSWSAPARAVVKAVRCGADQLELLRGRPALDGVELAAELLDLLRSAAERPIRGMPDELEVLRCLPEPRVEGVHGGRHGRDCFVEVVVELEGLGRAAEPFRGGGARCGGRGEPVVGQRRRAAAGDIRVGGVVGAVGHDVALDEPGVHDRCSRDRQRRHRSRRQPGSAFRSSSGREPEVLPDLAHDTRLARHAARTAEALGHVDDVDLLVAHRDDPAGPPERR